MRMVIEISDELHERFKEACSVAGTSQAKLVRGWVQAWVDGGRSEMRRPDLSKKAQAKGRTRT